jgi:hypothetical protein
MTKASLTVAPFAVSRRRLMCGIAGWIDNNRNLMDEGGVIRKMTDTLVRRGTGCGRHLP